MKRLVLSVLSGLLAVNLFAGITGEPVLKLFDQYCKAEPGKNFLLSPFSLKQAFGMVACGAGEKSGKELADILGVSKERAVSMKEHAVSLTADSNFFKNYNTLLLNRKFALKPQFVNDAANFFSGRIYKVDFSRSIECAGMLNSLVNKQTNGMFDELFHAEEFNDSVVLFLMNVLYFNAEWDEPFSAHLTEKENFKLPGGEVLPVDMMYDKRRIPYFNDGRIQAITMAYCEDRFNIMFLMPQDAAQNLDIVTGEIAEKGLDNIIKNSTVEYETVIKLPKLDLSLECDLIKLLRAAGMSNIFDPVNADLTGIVENTPLYISNAKQNVKLKIDESGTEMSVVTRFGMKGVMAAPGPPPQVNYFIADRPFVLVLFDRITGEILLAGAINRP